MAVVELKNVTKIYDNKLKVVSNVNVTINDSEFVVLVGPSGCGKSTTLRMIAGLEEISEGQIFIDNKLINDVSPKNRDIAMVFQNYALYPHMTVYENMAFGLKLRKFSKEEIKRRVLDAAKILDLEEFLGRKPKALSGGQRQRVAVGRAIVRKPKVFLFDEPLSNLDAKLRVQMRTEISKLHQRLKATMIYVTHDQTEAMTMGDKIVVMKDGVVQQVDTPMNLYNNPGNKFVAGFIGSPAMNFIEGMITDLNGLKFESVNKKLIISVGVEQSNMLKGYIQKKIFLGIRPEDIHDFKDESLITNCYEFEVILEIVEPMGNEAYLYFNLDNVQFISRIPARDIPQTGSLRKLKINLKRIHFFDFENEKVIN
ncbi:MAG: sn-glycerol-3-phosphate ABC transporter ATP-binding protein UgpC [Ignavibacteriales bacterium]|nr:MAG: sn-glycerol-3-phosphate ABC transporter ATP-binding protein UgpC [Ignavibacteriales bacterium]